MFRQTIRPRSDWKEKANDYGFHFHTMYGEAYWDESAFYQFTLPQIEDHIEAPTEEIHQMCLHVVDKVVADDELLKKFCIPEHAWDTILNSWRQKDPSLYSRLDLAYDGKSPAKLLENNADTPTSLYETGFWQWLWLEDCVNSGSISRHADQFNSLQEKLIQRFHNIGEHYGINNLHFACCKDTIEDRGTVQYLQDCAREAGLSNTFVFVEDIGLSQEGFFSDQYDRPINTLFKLYPWEFMFEESFGAHIESSETHWLEPPWKAIISNKAILAELWRSFPNHPNLLPAWFESDTPLDGVDHVVKKPLFSREGANISIHNKGELTSHADGPYGAEGYILQGYSPLPVLSGNHTVIGSWLVNDQAAGLSIREDSSPITQDMSRYLPHIII